VMDKDSGNDVLLDDTEELVIEDIHIDEEMEEKKNEMENTVDMSEKEERNSVKKGEENHVDDRRESEKEQNGEQDRDRDKRDRSRERMREREKEREKAKGERDRDRDLEDRISKRLRTKEERYDGDDSDFEGERNRRERERERNNLKDGYQSRERIRDDERKEERRERKEEGPIQKPRKEQEIACGVFIGNLAKEVKRDQLHTDAAHYGPLKYCWRVENLPYGVVFYEKESTVENALPYLQDTTICFQKIFVLPFSKVSYYLEPGHSEFSNTLYVSNLPNTITEDQLLYEFSKYGTVTRNSIISTPNQPTVAFIHFRKLHEAKDAQKYLQGKVLFLVKEVQTNKQKQKNKKQNKIKSNQIKTKRK